MRWIILFAMAVCARGQTAAHFDVASVKSNRTSACRGRWDFSVLHGTLRAENAPLLRIVSRAYGLTDDRVLGPGWLDSQCYDIQAKASGGARDRDVMAMLRALLRERFHIEAHMESDERPILALVVDKGGPRLPRYDEPPDARPAAPDGSILFMARHLPDLCERLGKVAGRPVVDKTGLTGDYWIVLTYVPLASLNEEAPDIFRAVREQLGLRLDAERGAVDVLKIDSIDKVPTEN